MKTLEIIEHLSNGGQFENQASNWYTLVNMSNNRFMLFVNDKFITYGNIEKLAKRVCTLMKKG